MGTVFAFCAGAAVVVAGQHFVGTPGGGKSQNSGHRARSSATCEALALLKTTRKSDASPKLLTESTSNEAQNVDAVSPEPGSEASPPTTIPPLPEQNSDPLPAEAGTQANHSVRVPGAVTVLDPNLLGFTLPSVSPKVTGDFQLPKADYPVSDPLTDAQRISPTTTIPARVDTKVEGAELDVQPQESTKPAVSLANDAVGKPEASTAEPAEAKNELAVAPVDTQPREGTSTDKPTSAATAQAGPSEQMEALKTKIRRVLDHHRHRMLNTRDHGAWETMHSFIAYGVEKELQVGGPGGRKVNAIGWVCFNGPCAGERLFTQGTDGPMGRLGPGLQGHEGQFLAMLAQCRVEPTYPMKVDGRDYTVMDLVRQEQSSCRSGSELTFKLIGLMHYLKSDDTWKDANGGEWGIPRLIREELAQPIIGATCGGTHRLFGLTYAYKKRQQRGEPVTGQYRRAQVYIKDFQEYTFNLQNPDGSFSTAFFAGRGDTPDPQRRLETTGHIAEWLTFSLENQQLTEPRMVKAIDYLATLLDSNPNMQWKVGPVGHALHALNMYDSFVFGGTAYPRPTEVATEPRRTAADRSAARSPVESSSENAAAAAKP
jgi:hypothetical protein